MLRSLLVLVLLSLLGCPGEKSRSLTEEIGGAPKRQLDRVQGAVDRAVDQTEKRLENLEEEQP
jgi:hypothetical protein